jgi:hypothetical protein
MDNATQSAESIKKDIENLRSRFVTIDKEDKCWKCGLGLVSKGFYVFPCQHAFHADCLISMVSSPPMVFGPKLIDRQWSSCLQHPFEGYTTFKKNWSRNQTRQVEHSCRPPSPLDPAPVAGTGSTATDLLLGVTGRNKLLAAGDKLRELIIPDVLAQAVSVVGQGVGVGPVSSQKKTKRDGTGLSEEQTARLKGQLDKIVAAVCPLCEGSVVGLDKPFVVDGEGLDWEV